MLSESEEKKLVEYLALIYLRIPWGKMRTRHNPHDIFNHRVRSASRRANLYQFASDLNNKFGLQTQSAEAQEILDSLRSRENEVLNVLSSEHIPLCVRATSLAKILREKRKVEKKDGN